MTEDELTTLHDKSSYHRKEMERVGKYTTFWSTKSEAEAVARYVGGTAHDLGDGESWYVLGETNAETRTRSRWERSEDGRAVIAGDGAPEL